MQPSERSRGCCGRGTKETKPALDALVPLVYGDLHRLAHRYMASERPDHTLRMTVLVNKAYVRLVDSAHASWESHHGQRNDHYHIGVPRGMGSFQGV